MKKILIADDELLVRIGLKTTIPWEQHGYDIVGYAKNGKEALELYDLYNPDILITDIKMPIIDGIDLMKRVKEKNKYLKVIILSHYEDFEYAKEAIKYGASDYLLKSNLDPDVLLSILEKVSREIDEETHHYKKLDDPGYANRNNINIALKRIVLHEYSSQQELNEIIRSSGLIDWKGLFAVASVSSTELLNDENESIDLLNRALNITQNIKTKGEELCHLQVTSNDLVMIFRFPDDKDCPMNKLINQISVFRNNWNMYLETDFIVGISNFFHSIDELPINIKNARQALSECFFESSGIYVYKENNVVENISPIIEPNIIRSYVLNQNKDALMEYIKDIFEILKQARSIISAKSVFIDFISLCKILIYEKKITNYRAFSENKLRYDNFYKLMNIDIMEKYICDLFAELVSHNSGEESEQYSFVIKKCIKYIKENYNKNITLGDIAKHVNISKSYLSLLFKQETDVNLSTYLTNYRIEKSKQLLKKTDLKIYEIAEKVGYDNPYYFSRVFKEVVGLSCKEYKNLNFES